MKNILQTLFGGGKKSGAGHEQDKAKKVAALGLGDFLAQRNYEDHREEDFSNPRYYPIQKTADPYIFSFELNGETVQFGKLPDGTAGTMNDTSFYILASTRREQDHLHNRGVLSETDNNVLILPFFFALMFYKELNVFVCSVITGKAGDQQEGIYDCYYFDRKGRYLQHEKGHYAPRLPSMAFVEGTGPVAISPLPAGYFMQRIVSWDLFIVGTGEEQLGLMSNTGDMLLECRYKKIETEAGSSIVLLQDDEGVVKFNLDDRQKTRLPYHSIAVAKHGMIQVEQANKWGLIRMNGDALLPPVYDYVEATYTPSQFKIFTGHYEWIWDDVSQKVFDDLLDPCSFNNDEFKGRIGAGKWGILDEQLNYIVPPEYDWIEELSADKYLLNNGGILYCYYNGDEGEDEWALTGGSWRICTTGGELLEELDANNWPAIVRSLSAGNPASFYEQTAKRAFRMEH